MSRPVVKTESQSSAPSAAPAADIPPRALTDTERSTDTERMLHRVLERQAPGSLLASFEDYLRGEGANVPPATTPRAMRLAVVGTSGDPHSFDHFCRNPSCYTDLVRSLPATLPMLAPGAENATVLLTGEPWADHAMVRLFLEGKVKACEFYVCAPFVAEEFQTRAPMDTGAGMNFDHAEFKAITGVDSLREIALCVARGAKVHIFPTPHERNQAMGVSSTHMIAMLHGNDIRRALFTNAAEIQAANPALSSCPAVRIATETRPTMTTDPATRSVVNYPTVPYMLHRTVPAPARASAKKRSRKAQ